MRAKLRPQLRSTCNPLGSPAAVSIRNPTVADERCVAMKPSRRSSVVLPSRMYVACRLCGRISGEIRESRARCVRPTFSGMKSARPRDAGRAHACGAMSGDDLRERDARRTCFFLILPSRLRGDSPFLTFRFVLCLRRAACDRCRSSSEGARNRALAHSYHDTSVARNRSGCPRFPGERDHTRRSATTTSRGWESFEDPTEPFPWACACG